MTNDILNEKPAFEQYLAKGIGYDQYKLNMAADLVTNPDPATKDYINLNQHRMHRVEKTYVPTAAMVQVLAGLQQPVYWLVLTEHWCGDAAQVLPVAEAIALQSGVNITLKLVYRDENDALMNAFLTNGARSIPKIIQLNTTFQVTGTWGPRPAEAQQLVKQLKADATTAETYGNQLHLWYAKNKQILLDKEFVELLMKA